jgi:predicted aldo/keto reductase-like oxidoreductase
VKYRKFGKLDWEVSALGFGAMRLPHAEGDYAVILEDQAKAMLRYAIDMGVNYVDTAWPYHQGESEKFLGRALLEGYREKVRLATKMPSWKIEKAEDFDTHFYEQLKRLQTDRIDFYLIHSLQRDWWDRLKGLGVLDWCEGKMAEGTIGHMGFSFHDRLPLFKRIVDDYDNWTLAMMMYNYMDTEYQAGREGLEYAAGKDLAIVVMEPLRGGLLAKEPPRTVAKLFRDAPIQRTPADWSLQWLWSIPEVSVVISGMSTIEQVEENLASADASSAGLLTADDLQLLGKVREEYEKKAVIPCTDCRYCMPCPQGVAIPWVFEYYNLFEVYEDLKTAIQQYAFLGEKSNASLCNRCGHCEEQCPQHIEIMDWLEKSHELMGVEKAPG